MTRPVRGSREGSRTAGGNVGVGVAIGVLLVVPFVALLWVGSYAKAKPTLFGFPFFYWYQLLWVIIAAALTFAAYLLVRGVDRRRAVEAAEDGRRAEADGGERR